MNTSPQTSFLYEIAAGLPIPIEKRAYFQARCLNRIYAFILRKFLEQEQSQGLTKAELARRIGKRPEIVSRLLGAPGNWQLETASDLLLGISGEELEFSASSVSNVSPGNYAGPDWLRVPTPPRPPLDVKPSGSQSFDSTRMIEDILRKPGSFVPAISHD